MYRGMVLRHCSIQVQGMALNNQVTVVGYISVVFCCGVGVQSLNKMCQQAKLWFIVKILNMPHGNMLITFRPPQSSP